MDSHEQEIHDAADTLIYAAKQLLYSAKQVECDTCQMSMRTGQSPPAEKCELHTNGKGPATQLQDWTEEIHNTPTVESDEKEIHEAANILMFMRTGQSAEERRLEAANTLMFMRTGLSAEEHELAAKGKGPATPQPQGWADEETTPGKFHQDEKLEASEVVNVEKECDQRQSDTTADKGSPCPQTPGKRRGSKKVEKTKLLQHAKARLRKTYNRIMSQNLRRQSEYHKSALRNEENKENEEEGDENGGTAEEKEE